MSLRHQLPVYSPVPIGAVAAAAARRGGEQDAQRLRTLLRGDFDASEAVLCGSGTQALQLAISLASGRVGSSAIGLPAFSCYDVASAAIGAGGTIALYDMDPKTLGPDMESLEALLRSGVRVVVGAHLYGMPLDWDALAGLANSYGAILIEDAAQGHGGAWRGRRLGGLGELSVLSFGRGKGWTGGAGGALLLRGQAAAAAHPHLSDSGGPGRVFLGTVAQWSLGRPALYRLPSALPGLGLGETRYHEPRQPERISGFSASLAMRSRAAADAEGASRRAVAAELVATLAGIPGIGLPQVTPDGTPGYLRLPVRLKRGLDAFADVADALRLGIGRSYPTTLAALPQVQKRLSQVPTSLAGAETLRSELVTLPTHSLVRTDERASVVERLRSAHLSATDIAAPPADRFQSA